MGYGGYPLPDKERCTAKNRQGNRCGRRVAPGATVCSNHGGRSPQVRRKADIIAEVQNWRAYTPEVDPGEQLLRMIAVTAYRQHRLAKLLDEQTRTNEPDVQWFEEAAGFIGHKFSLTKAGDPVAVEEAVRALVSLEQRERELVVQFSEKAIRSGLDARMVELAERQATMMFGAIQSILSRLELTEHQQTIAGEVVVSELEKLASGGNVPDVPSEALAAAESVR